MQYRDSAHAEYVADQRVTSAKKALVHYLWLSIGQAANGEAGTEIEGIVDDIVEAAVARVEQAIHKEREANPVQVVKVPAAEPKGVNIDDSEEDELMPWERNPAGASPR